MDVCFSRAIRSNNSVIEYDPRLATVILKTGLGGWAVTGFQETAE